MTPPGWYEDPQDPSRLRWWDGFAWTAQIAARPAVPSAPAYQASAYQAPAYQVVSNQPPEMPAAPAVTAVARHEMADLQARIHTLREQYNDLRQQIVETSDVMLLQEVGLYKYSHPLDTSDQYKAILEDIVIACKQRIKDGGAVTSTKRWAINGSDKEGARMVSDFSRLITDEYHVLRVKEVQLTGDYQAKLAEEREAERDRRARLREEKIARREFEAEQRRLEKEQAHYANKAAALLATGDTSGAAEAQSQVAELQRAIDRVIDRAANIRAGYVYVISTSARSAPVWSRSA